MYNEKYKELDCLFNTAYFIVKEGIAFLKFKQLCELQMKNGLLLGVNYKNDIACRMFVKAIAGNLRDNLATLLAKARFISVLSDGSADAGIVEQELVFGRFLFNGNLATKYIGIQPINKPNSMQTLEAFEAALDNASNCEVSDLYNKIINCNFGANVMAGMFFGVHALMAEKQDAMIYTHCVAHKLEFALLDAVKSYPYLKGSNPTRP